MKRLILAGVALQLCALPALAQNAPAPVNVPDTTASPKPATTAKPTTTTQAPPSTPAGSMTRSDQANATAPAGAVPGANSFTESQARSRLEKNGYSQVTGLTKDNDGIWRGAATKNGSSVHVTVDYKGNISMN